MNGTPLGFWQKNPILRNVITPQYTLPHPRDIHRILAYIKGLQSVKWHYFPTDIHTPNKVTLNTRKSKITAISCDSLKQLYQRKSLTDCIIQSAQAYFFTFQYAPTICLRSAYQLYTKYHPDSYSQGYIQKLSALYHLFHIFRCHISHKSRNHHKRSHHNLIQ